MQRSYLSLHEFLSDLIQFFICRIHKFMGVYDATGKLNEVKTSKLLATDNLRVMAEKLSLLSILDRTVDLTRKPKFLK